MKRYTFSCFLVTLLLAVSAMGQELGYTERAKKYIDEYATLAILEQRKSGIPASITLGQGILETEAGASELMTAANNHFGIKCKNGWQGPTFTHTDDAPDECFKKYNCAAESYKDHSDHLHRNPRYSPLFTISPTDYEGWAKCLKKCGYATNPQYAQRLIKIIEDFKLQEYTIVALDSTKNVFPQPSAVGNNANDAQKPLSLMDNKAAAIRSIDANPLSRIADSARNAVMHPANNLPSANTVAVTKFDTVRKVATTATPVPKTIIATPPVKTETVNTAVAAVVPATNTNKDLTSNLVVPTDNNAAHHINVAQETVQTAIAEESHVVMVNGLQAFYAYKDEMILKYAMKYHIGYQQLLAYNELSDGPLPHNMYVYLERKLTKGTNGQHIMRDGETLYEAAQIEGMQVRSLREMNLLNPNEEPLPGTILELQKTAMKKPLVSTGQLAAHNRNSIVINEGISESKGGDFITIPKSKVPTFADTAKPANMVPLATTNNASKIKVTNEEVLAVAPTDAASVSGPNSNAGAITHHESGELPKYEASVAIPQQAVVDNHLAEQPVKTQDKTAQMYTVRKGDTAFSIAKNNNISLEQLAKWNNLDKNQVKIGQVLQVKE